MATVGTPLIEETHAIGYNVLQWTIAQLRCLAATRANNEQVHHIVLGENDLGPNVCAEDAISEMEKIGYVLKRDFHILDCDEIYKETNPEKIGSPEIVFNL